MSQIKNNEITHTGNSGTSNIVLGSSGQVTIAGDLTPSKLKFGSDAAGDIAYYNGTQYVTLAPAGASKTLKMNSSNNAPEWVTVAASATAFTSYAVFWDQKANNTQGGTASSGSWQVRELNQETDPDGIASVSTNVVTVAAGSYLFKWRCPAYDCNEHQSALYDVTNTTRYPGTGSYANASETHNDYSEGIVRLTLSGSTEVRLEHQVNTTSGGNGWGTAVNFSENNIYSILEIYKE